MLAKGGLDRAKQGSLEAVVSLPALSQSKSAVHQPRERKVSIRFASQGPFLFYLRGLSIKGTPWKCVLGSPVDVAYKGGSLIITATTHGELNFVSGAFHTTLHSKSII